MARFGVYRVDGRLVVDVQTDYLPDVSTRLVIPLETLDRAPRVTRQLNPILLVDGQRLMLITQQMSPVPKRSLGHEVASLRNQGDDVTAAIDVLLTGF